jgi:redox-sensitive bicupin YhaK (pirin superfamily)
LISRPDERVREVSRVVPSTPTVEGAGVRLRRAIGGPSLALLDPFLLLDEFRSDNPDDYAPGFPDHPHRGFETVTYMIDGVMEHRDSVGNRGRLGPGSAQWMTAGHGIIHSEMPKQERGLMWGLQLWVNLPRSRKMTKPRYQDIAPSAITSVERERARVRVVAGTVFGTEGPVQGIDVAPTAIDVTLERGGTLDLALPREHAVFAYVLAGAVRFGASGREVRERELAILAPGDACRVRSDAAEARTLVVAAAPIGEPVARRGPFVMNTDEEIQQAFDDYRTGRLTQGI